MSAVFWSREPGSELWVPPPSRLRQGSAFVVVALSRRCGVAVLRRCGVRSSRW